MPKHNTKHIVDGYTFENEEQERQARKELEGVRYIKRELDMGNPELVLDIYHRILREKTFTTPIGYSFLRELQEFLRTSPQIENKYIHPIDFQPVVQSSDAQDKRVRKYKNLFIQSVIINIALGIAVIAMFLLVHFSDIPTILDYENKLIDKYEKWEQQLNEREDRIYEYEKKYEIIDGY